MAIPTFNKDQQAVVALLELDAIATIPSIAKRLKKRVHSIQYIISKLEGAGAIKRAVFVDVHKLGFRYCGVFFSVTGSALEKRAMVRFLKSSDSIGWFAELGGEFAYGMAVLARTANEANEFLLSVIKHTQVKIYRKAISFRLHLIDTPRYYLANGSFERSPLSVRDGVAEVAMDDLDRKILSLMSERAELSNRAMAATLGIPHTTFDLRVRKLRTSGVIVGFTLEVDLQYLRRQAFKILLISRGKDPSLSTALQRFAITHPSVSHYVECFGEWDYELNLEVETFAEVQQFLEQLQDTFGDQLLDCRPLSVLKTHRICRYPLRS